MSSNARNVVIGAVAVVLLAAASAFFMWPSMPTIGKEANEAAAALLSATSRKDEQSIVAVENAIAKWVAEGTLPESDREVLDSIIELAKAKQWDKAYAKARKLKEAQIQPSGQ